jgi:hypothetical protein
MIIGGFFLFMALVPEIHQQGLEQSSVTQKSNKKPIDLINEHLQKTYDKDAIDKLNVENQNKVFAPSLKDTGEEAILTESEIDALYGGAKYEDLIRKEINARNAIEDKRYKNELEKKALADQELDQRKYREKYAPALFEKARREGFEVELDENFYIKNVIKIPGGKNKEDKKQYREKK